MIFDYLLVFIFQVFFNILKVHEIKFSYEGNTRKLMVNSVLMNILTLLSFYYTVNLMLSGDWVVFIVFVVGGALGKFIAVTNFESHRKEIWKKLKSKSKK